MTADMPKAMAPYADGTLIAAGIAQISRHIPNVHITVGWKGAMLAEHVIRCGARSVISTDGQSNSWWMYHTLLAELDEPIYVLTCDNIVELDFDLLESEYFAEGEPACMLVPVRPIEGLEGDWIFRDGRVVTKISRTEPSEVYCSGIQVVNPRKVQELTDGSGNFYTVWDQLIDHGEVMASRVYPSRWFSVDTLAQLETLTADS